MGYLIGIDGGGTKTHCIITDESLNILYECTGGPSNFLLLGVEIVSGTIANLIEECKSILNIEYEDIISVVLGTTGAGRISDAQKMEKGFKDFAASGGIELKNFHVVSDAACALEGAFSGGPGSILISGTGSIIFGKDKEGKVHRAGGFGHLIGDEGSGRMIGRKGLMAVARSFDGRGGKTTLTEALKEKFNISTQEELIIEVYSRGFDIASAAPLVFAAAEQNDPACMRIVDEETDELILHVSAMKTKLNEETMSLALTGSLITTDNFYSRTFIKKLNGFLMNIIIKEPEHSPAMGAVLIAKKLIN